MRRATAVGAMALSLLLIPGILRAAPAEGPVPFAPPLAHPPMDPPLRLTGSFGEYRQGHFHAGVDLSTGELVGRPVYASLDGHIERVRASGVGYGRSVYLRADDGRLLVYGHLDAFDAPLAAYVQGIQDSSGQYEQDLWPEPSRIPVRAGQRLGWSGRSGTGPPHLHFEIRHGDFALNPLRAGLTVEDSVAPVLRRVTFEPLDGGAIAGRRAGPVTLELESWPDTLRLFGSARASLEAVDARAGGRMTMAPWRTTMTVVGGEAVSCSFDSVSWADGMSEVDEVYDRGRAAPDGQHSVRLWAPGAWRPRALRTAAPPGQEVGVVRADSGGASRLLFFEAWDAAGHRTSRGLPLRLWTPDPAWRDSLRGSGVARARLRAWCTDGAAALLDRAGDSLHAVALEPGRALRVRAGRWEITIPESAAFESRRGVAGAVPTPALPAELRAEGGAVALLPDLFALRVPLEVRVSAPGPGPLGLYRVDGTGWEWLGARRDTVARAMVATSRHPGVFALLRDTQAPRVHLPAPPRRAPAGPYPRWALEASLDDAGSGVSARESYFQVDGRRVPSEWDADQQILRWRPATAPAKGTHRVEVVATDRCGNVRRSHATFVLD